MGIQPTDRARRCLAAGERLLSQVKAIDLGCDQYSTHKDGASRIEIWETETFNGEARITVMEFDASGFALRASIFDNVRAAESWLARH